MEEHNSWKLFEMSGSVQDYLNYRAEAGDRKQGKENHEQHESGGYHAAGDDSSQYATGRL